MALAPLPPLSSAAFSGGAPGALADYWLQYLSSLDALIRTLESGKALSALPPSSAAVINPSTGAPTDPWRLYWNARDGILRTSIWMVGTKTAAQVLSPLPPTVGWSMVFPTSGVLVQPWALYMTSVDALARPQS